MVDLTEANIFELLSEVQRRCERGIYNFSQQAEHDVAALMRIAKDALPDEILLGRTGELE